MRALCKSGNFLLFCRYSANCGDFGRIMACLWHVFGSSIELFGRVPSWAAHVSKIRFDDERGSQDQADQCSLQLHRSCGEGDVHVISYAIHDNGMNGSSTRATMPCAIFVEEKRRLIVHNPQLDLYIISHHN